MSFVFKLISLVFFFTISSHFVNINAAETSIGSSTSTSLLIFYIKGVSAEKMGKLYKGNSFTVEPLFKKRKVDELDFYISDFLHKTWQSGSVEYSLLEELRGFALYKIEEVKKGEEQYDDPLIRDFIKLQKFLAPIGPIFDKKLSLFESFNSPSQGVTQSLFSRIRQTYYMLKWRLFRSHKFPKLPKVSLFTFNSLQDSDHLEQKELRLRLESIEKMIVATINYLYDLGLDKKLVTVILAEDFSTKKEPEKSKAIFIGEPVDPIKARRSFRTFKREPHSIDVFLTIRKLFFVEEEFQSLDYPVQALEVWD